MSSVSARRLTRKMAARVLRVTPVMVRYYEQQGLLHGKLDGRRMTYPQVEVKALKARNGAPTPDTLQRPDGVYLSGKAACKRLGVGATWLYHHAKATYHLGGAGVPTHRERGIIWYRDTEVEQIRYSMIAHRSGRFTIDNEDYLGIRTVQRVLGINPPTVYWLDRAGRVQTQLVKLGGDKEAKVYREACLKEYLRKRDLPFDGIYPDGRVNLAHAAKLARRSHGEIGCWIRRGWLSSRKQMPCPAMRGRTVKEHTVRPDELRQLIGTLDSALRQGRPVGGWKKIEELKKELGIKGGLKARAELLRTLSPGIANGAIKTFRSDYPTEQQGKTKRRRLYYDLDDVKRFLFSAPTIPTVTDSPKRAGRKHDPRSLRIQCFCFLEREKSPPTKMPTIRRTLEKILNINCPITNDRDVRVYKNRWRDYRKKYPQEARVIEAEHFPEILENYGKNW
jgi:hypothetical protein